MPLERPDLAAALDRAKTACPGVVMDEVAFCTWLTGRTHEPLEQLPVEELFLAWACARGDPLALKQLDTQYLSRLGAAIARVDGSAEFLDEVLQQLRERLLVSRGGELPRIDGYEGAGPLISWLRAAAVRTALNAKRPHAREAVDEDAALEELPLAGPDPELLLVRTQHRALFSEAFKVALGELSARERNVLRLQGLDGLSLERIGEVYGVNKSTVSRWLARVHEVLLQRTRAELGQRLALDTAQLDSLFQAMRSNLELSVARLLGEGA
ncbi:MAG: sigma-70 family RNA polymerase sigma factor [Archangium sp.]|nr:sigma-70 family RNA polymerase sigma factor [Archangium sp.]